MALIVLGSPISRLAVFAISLRTVANRPCNQSKNRAPVTRLQKFVERRVNGKHTGRVAYAFDPDKLPVPASGNEWRLEHDFNAADEVLANDGLKAAFKLAIDAGYAIVER
jgi:hypothetical protein